MFGGAELRGQRPGYLRLLVDGEEAEKEVTPGHVRVASETITLRHDDPAGKWYACAPGKGETFTATSYKCESPSFEALMQSLNDWATTLDVPGSNGTSGGQDAKLISMVKDAAFRGTVDGGEGCATVLFHGEAVVGVLLAKKSGSTHTFYLRAIDANLRGRRLAGWMYEAYMLAWQPGPNVYADLRDCGTRGDALPSWRREGFDTSQARPGEAAVLRAAALSTEEVAERRKQYGVDAPAAAEPVAAATATTITTADPTDEAMDEAEAQVRLPQGAAVEAEAAEAEDEDEDEEQEVAEEAPSPTANVGKRPKASAKAPKPRHPIEVCNYIRYLGEGKWEARMGENGWWHGYTEDEIRERCDGANAGNMNEAEARPNVAVKLYQTGGFVVTSNKKLKAEHGLAIATGGGGRLRLCSARAAYTIVRNVRPELRGDRRASQARFETLLPGTELPKDDPSVEDVRRVLSDFDVSTEQVYVSVHQLVNVREGFLLVRLKLWYEHQDEPGFHFTVYAAASGAILDPDAASSNSVVVTDEDRAIGAGKSQSARKRARDKALRPFHEAFPAPQTIELAEVFRCARV